MSRCVLVLALAALPACALSHLGDRSGATDGEAPRDAGVTRDAFVVRDLGPPDLGLHDLGRPDLGPPDLGPTSGDCRSDVDCAAHPGTLCRHDPYAVAVDLAPIPLVCAPPNPGAAADGERCDDRDYRSCARSLCVVGGTCVAPCVAGSEDATTQRCGEVWVRTSDTSMQSLSGLTPRVVAPPDVTHASLAPTTVPDDPDGGVNVALDLPAATNVVVFESGESVAFASRFATRTPPSRLLYDAWAYSATSPPPLGPVSTLQSIPTLELPNSPTEPRDPANAYVVTLATFGLHPGSTFPGVVLQRATHGTTLDIDAFYCGASGFSRVPGADDVVAPLADAMVDVRRTFAAAGITIGEVRVHELVGGLRTRWAVIDWIGPMSPDEDLHGLFALSAGVPGPSVPWFFNRSATGLLGVSGGIPGPLGVPGTFASGVLVTVDVIGMTPDAPFHVVLEHETGHYLGLFHTSEADGGLLEPLADTPACRSDRDANGDGYCDATECTGYGADNVMFWAGDSDRTGFTRDQASVIDRALILR